MSQGNERRQKMEENDGKRRSSFLSARGDYKYNIPLILTAFIHLSDISIYNYILMPSIICLDMKLKFKHIQMYLFFRSNPVREMKFVHGLVEINQNIYAIFKYTQINRFIIYELSSISAFSSLSQKISV